MSDPKLLPIMTAAKSGDFSLVPSLCAQFYEDNQAFPDYETARFIGRVAPWSELKRFLTWIGGQHSQLANEIFFSSWSLAAMVPLCASRFDRELSWLCFSEVIQASEDQDDFTYSPQSARNAAVARMVAALSSRFPGIRHFAAGQPLHPRVWLDHLAILCHQDDFTAEFCTYGASIENDLEWLACWDNSLSLDPPSSHGALAEMVRMLKARDWNRFKSGVRYFANHIVPD